VEINFLPGNTNGGDCQFSSLKKYAMKVNGDEADTLLLPKRNS